MSRKRRFDDDGDDVIPSGSSPVMATRQMAHTRKKARANLSIGRSLGLARLVETLDASHLREVIERICERHPEIGHEIVSTAPRPSLEATQRVLEQYQSKLKEAWPYGNSSEDYSYFRVQAPLEALLDAITDFTPQYLPPIETHATVSLQYLDMATKLIHELPNWQTRSYQHHKELAYEEISRAWETVVAEAGKRGVGFSLQSGGWDKTLEKHHQESGGRMLGPMRAMAETLGPFGDMAPANPGHPDSNSIINQLMSGTYGSAVKVGPW